MTGTPLTMENFAQMVDASRHEYANNTRAMHRRDELLMAIQRLLDLVVEKSAADV